MSEPRVSMARQYALLFVLFFSSGLSGLIYESIWSRYVRLFVGSAATAQVLVLSLYMGGMSLGALLAGRFIGRIRAPVLVYGVVEGIIGLYALAFPWLYDTVLRLAYDSLFPALGAGASVSVVKWTLAGALLMPPCVLLGTTFPLMSVGILRRSPERSGEILSLLYFTNSFGAALGALLSGFVFVGWLGLPGTLMVAAVVNLAIMLLSVTRRHADLPNIEVTLKDRVEEPLGNKVWLFLAVAFGTGLSSFMYEIGWIRLLSMIVGSATHSFEVMLSAFILGLALGGLWVRRRMDRYARPELVLASVQLIMGLAAIATLPAYRVAMLAMSGLLSDDTRTQATWLAFNVLRYALCLLIMLPATFCAGMTLPLLTHVMLRRGQRENAIGRVYGVNTLGAIAGAILAGLVLMPLVGLKTVIVLGALVDMVLGVVLIHGELKRSAAGGVRRLRSSAVFATVTSTCLGLWVIDVDPRDLSATVFRNGRRRLPEHFELLSYVDGRTASVTVAENREREGYRVIYTNGKPDASVVMNRWPKGRARSQGPDIAGDEPNQFLVGFVPLMLRPRTQDAVLIGFGSGVTCHTMLASPHLQRLDTVEIEPEMVEGSRFFYPSNARAYDDPRSHIHFEDAKAYFAAAGGQWDLIVSEPTNPWVSGVSSLFTTEFYREVKRYLRPNGLLAQWIQGYELSDALLISVFSAIDAEFEDYLVVRIGSRDWVIVASPRGPVGDLQAEPLAWANAAELREVLGIHDVAQVERLVVGNRRLLHPFVSAYQPNRDALPILDTGAERDRFFKASAEFLHALRWTPGPVLEVMAGLQWRPYPPAGIGDLRAPHVLREAEQAALLMRAYQEPNVAMPEETSTYSMSQWRNANAMLESGEPEWNAWMLATYEVYRETASHLDLTHTAWWNAVVTTSRAGKAPARVREAVELLDALSAVDGPRLLHASQGALEDDDFMLPEVFVTLAGMIALELTDADAAQRRAYVQRYMASIADGDSSEDLAYQALRERFLAG